MSLRLYLWLMTATTLLSWIGFSIVVNLMSPEDGFTGLVLFYISLTLGLTGTFALVGFCLRFLFLRSEQTFKHVSISFRQGLFFALLIDGFMLLQSMRLLTWYNSALLILGLTLAEFFVISKKSTYRS